MRVLRHRDFRLLFLGQAASQIGSQVVIVALALFISRRTGSATDLGIVLAANSIPFVGLLLLGGVWADRLPRHQVMIASDVIRGVLHALLAVLIFTGAVRVWEIAVIEALFGAATAFFQPAETGILPQTVPEDEIQEARAVSEASFNLAMFLGPTLATALVLTLGAGYAFAFDAATFVLGTAVLVPIRLRDRGVDEADDSKESSVLQELREGWQEVVSRSWVWVTIVAYSGILLVSFAPLMTLGPLLARHNYHSLSVWGILIAVSGLGSVLASLVGIVWKPRRQLWIGLAISITWPLANVLFALAAARGLVVGAYALGGFTTGLMMVAWESSLAHHIPPSALSRVSSYDWMGSLALTPLGYVLAGPLAAQLGLRAVILGGGVIGMVLVLVSLLPRSTWNLPVLSGEAAPGADQPSSSAAMSA
jgi:MFS family permease